MHLISYLNTGELFLFETTNSQTWMGTFEGFNGEQGILLVGRPVRLLIGQTKEGVIGLGRMLPMVPFLNKDSQDFKKVPFVINNIVYPVPINMETVTDPGHLKGIQDMYQSTVSSIILQR